jgi:phosphohistidine phosphatase
MRRLILLRHAKAEAARPGDGDFGRRLTGRGRRDAAAIGEVLAARKFAPDLALTSTARRAKETWECASPAFPKTRLESLGELYDAAPHTIFEAVSRCANDADTLLVVGHNPGLQELAVALVAEGSGAASDIRRLASEFPTATAAVFTVDQAGRFALEDFLKPQRHEKPRSSSR